MKDRSVRILNSPEVSAFLSGESKPARDRQMSERCLCDVYRTSTDGALLVLFDGTGRYYERYDDLLTVVDRARDQRSAVDLMPDGSTFAERVDALIAELPSLLDVNPSHLDLSLTSLRFVDAALGRLDRSRVVAPSVFPVVLAYLGEVIRRAINGEWEVHLQKDGTWEPDVRDRHGNRCHVFGIYKELLEHGKGASLVAFAQVRMRTRTRP